jgi:signal transduction histidine kinase
MSIKLLAQKTSLLFHRLSLGLMLLTLHVVLVWGLDDFVQKAFLVCHFGFFLLWQPIWRTPAARSNMVAALFIAGGLFLTYNMNWWLMAFWVSVLFGLLGGRIFSSLTRSRLAYLFAAGYLLAMLLLWVVPKLLTTTQEIAITEFIITFLMPLLPTAILIAAADESDSPTPPTIDFFYTLLLLFLAVTLVLGSYAIETASGANYAEVLIKLLFGLAFALLAISWLWNPRAGFAGIGHLLSRYLLSLGLPFEQWVRSIAELADSKTTSKEFIESAMHEISKLPWVSGVTWDTEHSSGELGIKSKHLSTLSFRGILMQLFTKFTLTPALSLHLKLLTQILGEFYEAKRREETLQQNAYMQAIYETGARLTHDIKNIVQSMSGLCTAAEQTPTSDDARLANLIRRQLPQLNRRLAMTLDKLQAPASKNKRSTKLSDWWNALQQRYQNSKVSFLCGQIPDIMVDDEVVDSVVDNLLQNAIEKSRSQQGIEIIAELSTGDRFCIEVSDSGKAMPKERAEHLFKQHVRSENGLGIGLYHAAKQSQQAGFNLSLVSNKDGDVRFRLIQSSQN